MAEEGNKLSGEKWVRSESGMPTVMSGQEYSYRHTHDYAPHTASKHADLVKDTLAPAVGIHTNTGVLVSGNTVAELMAGVGGPALLQDFVFREKVTSFDRERIPERVVHARGAGAHGYFECTNDASDITCAKVFQQGCRTEAFVRFSTVTGSRGSTDLPRDPRGFAIKLYTVEGNLDIVANNMSPFFVNTAIKFPDFVHAAKPSPTTEIPQAASAHDSFWDFCSLTPESAHMLMWLMSDRAIPRSYSNMEAFGVNTFQFVNANGQAVFMKWLVHPVKGVAALTWDEAQEISGRDPDFHRRKLYQDIGNGDFPEYELGVQVVPADRVADLGTNLLDSTKILFEEEFPIRVLGKLVLNRTPSDFFAETEQAAFCPSHIVPGVDFSDDPLLHGRLFSYLDTQLHRVGNFFQELPINRPRCPFMRGNHQTEGLHRFMIHTGEANYAPNSLNCAHEDGDASSCPNGCSAQTECTPNSNVSGSRLQVVDAGYSFHPSTPFAVNGEKTRTVPPSFGEHFSQARTFWNSQSSWEKLHIAAAFSFELNNCKLERVRKRVVEKILQNIDERLANEVAVRIGLVPNAEPRLDIGPGRGDPNASSGEGRPLAGSAGEAAHMATRAHPSLSLDRPVPTLRGRTVALLCGENTPENLITSVKESLTSKGILSRIIASTAGFMCGVPVDMPLQNTASVFFDAVAVLGPKAVAAPDYPSLPAGFTRQHLLFVEEAFRHCKPIIFFASAVDLTPCLQCPQLNLNCSEDSWAASYAVTVASNFKMEAINGFLNDMLLHRCFQREIDKLV